MRFVFVEDRGQREAASSAVSVEYSAVLLQTWDDLVEQVPASSFRSRVTIAYVLFDGFSSL